MLSFFSVFSTLRKLLVRDDYFFFSFRLYYLLPVEFGPLLYLIDRVDDIIGCWGNLDPLDYINQDSFYMQAFMFTELFMLSNIFLHSVSNRNGINLRDETAKFIYKFEKFLSFEAKTLEDVFNW